MRVRHTCDIWAKRCAKRGCKNVVPLHHADFVLPRSVVRNVFCKDHVPRAPREHDVYVIELIVPGRPVLIDEFVGFDRKTGEERFKKADVRKVEGRSAYARCALEIDTAEAERIVGETARKRARRPEDYLPIVTRAISLNTALDDRWAGFIRGRGAGK